MTENIGRTIIGVDPGLTIGVCVIDGGGSILSSFEADNNQFWNKITYFLLSSNTTIALEDIRPYSLALTPQVIETTKWIGEALYRLRNACGEGCIKLVSRYEVKRWVFDYFPEVCLPAIQKRIDAGVEKGKYVYRNGQIRKPSFHFVNDAIVKKSMTKLYGIETLKGKKNKFGLGAHSFQSLAVASYLRHSISLPVLT
jgi:hypothetical protein